MKATESGIPPASIELLVSAVQEQSALQYETDVATMYGRAHLVATRTAAAVLAARAHSSAAGPQNVWHVLARTAPELQEWAEFFAVVGAKYQVIRQGHAGIVSRREADDLVRESQTFLNVAVRCLAQGSLATQSMSG